MTREERLDKLLRLILRGLKNGNIKDASLISGDKVIALSAAIETALEK